MVSILNYSGRPERPTPVDLDKFLQWASYQLNAEYTLVVTRNVQSKYVSSIGKERAKPKTKPKLKTPSDSGSIPQVTSDLQLESKALNKSEENPIYIETTYDENDDLVRIKILKNKDIPRLLFQIIGLAIPYHKTLSSLIINDGLQADGIYEISKFYSTNRITESCLDSTHFPEANYHILLDNNVLKHLSLSKCNITDAVVKTIASKLHSKTPASRSLSVLNMSTNRITDVGVKYLAEILRTNRQLSYLNLADNRITDEGAKSILNTLTKFALTPEETLDRSRSLMSYLGEKNELILKTMKDLRICDVNRKSRSAKLVSTKKKLEKETSVYTKSNNNSEVNLFERAKAIVESSLGPFNNPFNPENIETRESVTYCLGNNTLSYLNLAFNNLTYCSVKRLCDVLKSQNILSRNPKGLINVRIEGNYIPESCREFQTIDGLLLPGLSVLKSVGYVKKRGTSSISRSNN